MSYIIVWRNSHREPFVDCNTRGFLETYNSYTEAKMAAEEMNTPKDPHYIDYQIYQEVNS